jgi:hypothetical protein
MAAMSGQSLKVTIDDTFIDGVDGWSFDNTIDSKDITVSKTTNDTLWKQYISTLRDAKGSITFKFLDLTDPGQLALWNAFNTSNTTVELKFYQDSSHYLFADCIITSFPISAKLDGVQGEGMTVSVQLQDLDGLQLGGYS